MLLLLLPKVMMLLPVCARRSVLAKYLINHKMHFNEIFKKQNLDVFDKHINSCFRQFYRY